MRKFGKEEIEVYADADLNDIRNFMLNIVEYVLCNDATLKDGETIGFSAGQVSNKRNATTIIAATPRNLSRNSYLCFKVQ